MAKRRKIIGLFLLVVYAYFFASTNFFYHSHQLANSKIVHSHPFNGKHAHTPGQIFVIGLFDAAVYQKSSDITVPDIVPLLACLEIPLRPEKDVFSCSVFSFSLRAPPAML